jgi:hypothetical protein
MRELPQIGYLQSQHPRSGWPDKEPPESARCLEKQQDAFRVQAPASGVAFCKCGALHEGHESHVVMVCDSNGVETFRAAGFNQVGRIGGAFVVGDAGRSGPLPITRRVDLKVTAIKVRSLSMPKPTYTIDPFPSSVVCAAPSAARISYPYNAIPRASEIASAQDVIGCIVPAYLHVREIDLVLQ